MARRKKTVEVPAPADALSEAKALLHRLADDSALRDALAGVVADAEQTLEKQKKALRKQTKKVKKRAIKAAQQAQPGKSAKSGKPGVGKLIVLGLLAGAGAVGVSPSLRSKVLDALFGAEEEFDYAPPAPAGDGPGLSAV